MEEHAERLRLDMKAALPSPSVQAENLERLIARAGLPSSKAQSTHKQ